MSEITMFTPFMWNLKHADMYASYYVNVIYSC